MNWFKYSSPASFYPLAGKLRPWLLGVALVLFPVALYLGFVVAPTDAQQGESYRIMFAHVATAILSMFLSLGLPAAVGRFYFDDHGDISGPRKAGAAARLSALCSESAPTRRTRARGN